MDPIELPHRVPDASGTSTLTITRGDGIAALDIAEPHSSGGAGVAIATEQVDQACDAIRAAAGLDSTERAAVRRAVEYIASAPSNGDVWARIGMRLGWTPEQAGMRARKIRTAEERVARRDAEAAKQHADEVYRQLAAVRDALGLPDVDPVPHVRQLRDELAAAQATVQRQAAVIDRLLAEPDHDPRGDDPADTEPSPTEADEDTDALRDELERGRAELNTAQEVAKRYADVVDRFRKALHRYDDDTDKLHRDLATAREELEEARAKLDRLSGPPTTRAAAPRATTPAPDLGTQLTAALQQAATSYANSVLTRALTAARVLDHVTRATTPTNTEQEA